jgi:hypothetical protein
MSGQGNFWKDVETKAKKTNPNPVSVGVVKTLKPFSINYNGLELSYANGDTIFVNHLMLDDNINLDVSSMDEAQSFSNSTAYQSPSFTAEVSGTQKQFVTDFYTWSKSVHNRFILHIGDYIAVQKLGNNTYIVLDKLQKVENEQ